MSDKTAQPAGGIPGRKILRRVLQTMALALGLLVFTITVVGFLLGSQAGSRWILDRALPLANNEAFEIRYEALQGNLLQGLVLQSPDLRLGDNRISAQRLELSWQPWSLLSGTLMIQRLHASSLTVHWQSPETGEEDEETAPAVPLNEMLDHILPLPLALQLGHLGADDMELSLDGTALPLRSMRLGLSLTGRQLSIGNLTLDATPARVQGAAQLSLDGSYPLQSTLSWSFRGDDETIPPLSGQLDIGGDLNVMELRHRLREPAALDSSGTVTIGLGDSLNGRAGPLSPRLDLQHAMDSLALEDTGLAVPGFLAGWRIEALNLITRGTPDDLLINGDLDIEATVRGDDSEPTPFSISTRWESALQGNIWRLDQLLLETGDNRLQLHGQVDWSDTLTVTADLALDAPEPAAIHPLPEGLELSALQTRAALELSAPPSGLSGQMELQALTAELNGQYLSGEGLLALEDNALRVDNLLLRSGDNRLAASGVVGESLDAELELDIPAINALYSPAQGAVSARLSLAGTLEQLSARAEARITGLQMEGLALDNLELNGHVDDGQVMVNLTADNLAAGGQQIDSTRLRIDGTLADHLIRLQAAGDPGTLDMALTGGWVDGDWQGMLDNTRIDSDAGVWQQDGAASLSVADDIQLSRTCWRQASARLCADAGLIQGKLNARMDLQGYPLSVFNHAQAEEILREFHGGQLPAFTAPPPGIVIPFVLPGALALTGTVDVSASAQGPPTDLRTLQLAANVTLNEMTLYLRQSGDSLPVPEPGDAENPEPGALVEQMLLEPASLNVSLEDGEWRADAAMELNQTELAGSNVTTRGTANAGITVTTSGALDGSVDLGFEDIAWLEALVPRLHGPTGQLQGTIRLGGQLDAPTLGAELSLREAAAQVPALGLSLEEIELQLANPATDRFTLTGQLRSGDGVLSVNSEILRPLDADRSINLNLRGENVEIANLQDLQASISPELTLTGDGSGLDLSGELRLPVLDITINELPESAVDVSADTVITSESPDVRNAALVERGPLQEIPLRGEIRVVLGDRVRFRGFGLEAGLSGSLDITQRPGATPLTYGELEVVDGRFETYGQSLDIEQGRLQFLGSYNNPALDIRAVRMVGDTRVGVQMNGTALNIRSRLFSTPALPDADVLAMLITGRPMSEAGAQESPSLVGAVARLGINQGQGLTEQIRGQLGLDTLALEAGSGSDLQDSSLTLGKFITPRIFVRYAVGLFDTENTLAIDYTLTEALKLEAQSGESQSLDLIYQMER